MRCMQEKAFLILFLLILQVPLLSIQERGTELIVETREGKKIGLYKDAYAFVIGNGNYNVDWSPLSGALKDVDEVAAALERFGYKVTLKKNLDKKSFIEAFTEFSIKYALKEENQILFYYAGHGKTRTLSNGEEMGYIVMTEAPKPEINLKGFELGSVDMQYIVTEAKKMTSRHVLFIFDSCFSGTILNLRADTTPEYISENVKHPVRQFITAGRADEKVPDTSVFKQTFLDLLEGRDKEPIPDGYITGEEMGVYLKQKVPQYNPRQHPQYGKINDPKLDKGDFVFINKKKKILSPPYLPGIDFSYLEIEAKWAKWQKIFENDVEILKEFEKNPDISPNSKKKSWEKILITYNDDNPFSDKDEQLRNHAKQRIHYWGNYRADQKAKGIKKKITPFNKEIFKNIQKGGKKYLVLIAINKYQRWRPLKEPVKDAEDIKEILLTRYYMDEVLELYDEKATKIEIIRLFKNLQITLKLNDSVLIFYSGHGHFDNYSKQGFWIPVDGGRDPDLRDRWIPQSVIKGLIAQIQAKHVFLISDSCFSGSFVRLSRGKTPTVIKYFKRGYDLRSRFVLTSGNNEAVPDQSEFSRQLKLVLRENNNPFLDVLTLYQEIRLGVRETTPLFGEIEGTNHQSGAIFLLFLREKFYKDGIFSEISE